VRCTLRSAPGRARTCCRQIDDLIERSQQSYISSYIPGARHAGTAPSSKLGRDLLLLRTLFLQGGSY